MATYIDQLLTRPRFLTGFRYLVAATSDGSNILVRTSNSRHASCPSNAAVREARCHTQPTEFRRIDTSTRYTVDRAGLYSGAIPIFGAQGAFPIGEL